MRPAGRPTVRTSAAAATTATMGRSRTIRVAMSIAKTRAIPPQPSCGQGATNRATSTTRPAAHKAKRISGSIPASNPRPPATVDVNTRGTAARLASGETRGTEPKWASSRGATAT